MLKILKRFAGFLGLVLFLSFVTVNAKTPSSDEATLFPTVMLVVFYTAQLLYTFGSAIISATMVLAIPTNNKLHVIAIVSYLVMMTVVMHGIVTTQAQVVMHGIVTTQAQAVTTQTEQFTAQEILMLLWLVYFPIMIIFDMINFNKALK